MIINPYAFGSIPRTYEISEIDSLTFETTELKYNSMILMDSTHLINACSGQNGDGFLRSFSFDSNIDNLTELDELEHDTTLGFHNSLIKIDDTHIALAYAGASNDGFIKTFSIDGSYNFTEIDSVEFDTVAGEHNSLLLIDSTHFVLASRGNSSDGFIRTFEIDGSYNITELDELEFNISQGTYNSLKKIGDYYVLAYAGPGNDGFIETFSIDGSYIISEIDIYEHDGLLGLTNSLVVIDDTHFALAYGGNNGIGIVKTFSIDGSGDNITEIDSYTYNSERGNWCSMVLIDSTHLLVASRNEVSTVLSGVIRSFEFDGSYDNITQLDAFEFDPSDCVYPSLVQISSSKYALSYNKFDVEEGILKTFNVT